MNLEDLLGCLEMLHAAQREDAAGLHQLADRLAELGDAALIRVILRTAIGVRQRLPWPTDQHVVGQVLNGWPIDVVDLMFARDRMVFTYDQKAEAWVGIMGENRVVLHTDVMRGLADNQNREVVVDMAPRPQAPEDGPSILGPAEYIPHEEESVDTK